MKKSLLTISLALLLIPSTAFANDWRYGRGHGHYRGRTVVVRDHHDSDGAMIAVGVLGGIATGILLDRVLTAPPAPRRVYSPAPPPAPRPRDPYDEGYREGYDQGVERGSYERYEEGRKRGYDEGYEDARRGKAY
jgi:hypothetical protein